MKRTCPFCKNSLHRNDLYFCSFCGQVLPDNAQLKNSSMKEIREIGTPESKIISFSKSIKSFYEKIAEEINPKMILIGIGMGILIAGGFYLFVRFTIPNITGLNNLVNIDVEETEESSESREEEEEKKPVSNIVELNVNLRTGVFNQYKVTDYIPYDIDLLFEVNGFESFEPYFNFLGGEVFTLSENIKDKVNPFFTAFMATRDGKQYWTFLLFPTDPALNPGTYKAFYTEKVGEALVVSTSNAIMEEVKSSKVGTSKSLSLNPNYVSTRSKIPVEGKMLVYAFDDNGKNMLNDMVVKTTSEELKSIIEAFKNVESSYMVVK